jgi:hypothetical protein
VYRKMFFSHKNMLRTVKIVPFPKYIDEIEVSPYVVRAAPTVEIQRIVDNFRTKYVGPQYDLRVEKVLNYGKVLPFTTQIISTKGPLLFYVTNGKRDTRITNVEAGPQLIEIYNALAGFVNARRGTEAERRLIKENIDDIDGLILHTARTVDGVRIPAPGSPGYQHIVSEVLSDYLSGRNEDYTKITIQFEVGLLYTIGLEKVYLDRKRSAVDAPVEMERSRRKRFDESTRERVDRIRDEMELEASIALSEREAEVDTAFSEVMEDPEYKAMFDEIVRSRAGRK